MRACDEDKIDISVHHSSITVPEPCAQELVEVWQVAEACDGESVWRSLHAGLQTALKREMANRLGVRFLIQIL